MPSQFTAGGKSCGEGEGMRARGSLFPYRWKIIQIVRDLTPLSDESIALMNLVSSGQMKYGRLAPDCQLVSIKPLRAGWLFLAFWDLKCQFHQTKGCEDNISPRLHPQLYTLYEMLHIFFYFSLFSFFFFSFLFLFFFFSFFFFVFSFFFFPFFLFPFVFFFYFFSSSFFSSSFFSFFRPFFLCLRSPIYSYIQFKKLLSIKKNFVKLDF